MRKMSATSRAGRPTARALRRAQTLQRADHFAQQVGRHLGIEGGGVQFLVPEQHLDDADIDLLFEQVGRKAMPPMSLGT